MYLVVLPIGFLLVKYIKNNLYWMALLLIALLINLYPINIGWFGINDICKYMFYVILGICFQSYKEIERIIAHPSFVIFVFLIASVSFFLIE